MSNRFRLALIVAGLVVAGIVIGVVVAGRGSDSNARSAETTTAGTVAGTSVQTPTSGGSPAITRPSATGRKIEIVFHNGKVQGGLPHVTVKQGSRVVLLVRADVSDEVHLHGYDIMRDVAPGDAARISFEATIPGRFEAELESRSLQILDLEVKP